MPGLDDTAGPATGRLALPRQGPDRLPGGRLLHRRGPGVAYGTAVSAHPGGVLVRRAAFSAVVLVGNRPAGAIWLDPDGLWRAAPTGAAALAVSGPQPDGDALEALEAWAPSFRRFGEARERVLAGLSGGDGEDATGLPPSSGPGDRGGGARGGVAGRRGEVVSLAAARRSRTKRR